MTTSLNLDNDAALLRGIETADAATVETFISAIREMRQPVRYSNQDGDRRAQARYCMANLRTIGNTPVKAWRREP